MSRTTTRWWLAGGVLVLAAVAALVVVPRLDHGSGRCDVRDLHALGVELGMDAVVIDPLRLSARVADGAVPAVGTAVTVPGGLVPPPSTYADVIALDPARDGGTLVTMALRPLDQTGGYPGTPSMPTMTPGARGTVTAVLDPVDKGEYLSTPGMYPPDAVPVPGPPGPGSLLVTRVVDGRVSYEELSGCAGAPVSGPPTEAPPAGTGRQRAQTGQHWTRPVARVDVDEPLGPGGGVDVVPGPSGQLDVTLDLSWRGARPVVGEDWATTGPARVDPGGSTRRTAVGCAAPDASQGPRECAATYRVAQPAGAGLGARTTVDPITARDLRGDTALTTTTGPITMTGLAGTVHATTGRGTVVGTHLTPEQVYVVADGPVDLQFDAPPQSVLVDGAGAVTLEVPRGTPYVVEDHTPSAPPPRVEVATAPVGVGSHDIDARSTGGVTVRYAP